MSSRNCVDLKEGENEDQEGQGRCNKKFTKRVSFPHGFTGIPSSAVLDNVV